MGIYPLAIQQFANWKVAHMQMVFFEQVKLPEVLLRFWSGDVDPLISVFALWNIPNDISILEIIGTQVTVPIHPNTHIPIPILIFIFPIVIQYCWNNILKQYLVNMAIVP